LTGGGRGQVTTTKIFLFIFMLSQYCLTVKQILADWPSLPNNLGGGGQLPLPRTPMHAKIEFNNYFIIYLLIKYETAAGCRKPFCVVN
jgi:hypothetical protein